MAQEKVPYESCPCQPVKAHVDILNKPIVWVLGGPGSGKGTQCEKIIAKYGFTHLSTGDLLRAEVKSGTERGKALGAIMEQGCLVPNEIVLELLTEAIRAKAAHSKGFLIDGYPRKKSQAIAFEKAIAPPSAILYFEASAETLTKRLLGRAESSGRADDNETTIKLRLKTFLENNQQILDQYPTKTSRINAETSVDAIFAEVQKVLDPIVAASVDISNKPIVWVLGGPGSGKGTQCDKIIAKYGFTHLSTGDLLRAEVKSGSERAKILAAIMEQGSLVPNIVVLELLTEAIRAKAANSKGFLIDGYPREKSQALAFEKAIAPPSAILYFEASAETLTKRLLGRAASSGRADDNETTIKLRLKTFLENNQQVLDQYPTKISRINAETSVDAIFAEVQKVLDPIVATRVEVLNKPIVWVLGGPGSGKGTQCDKIIAKYGFTHLSTGDLLRAEVKSGSERAKALAAIMEQGGLVPNEVVLELLTEAIRAKAANSKGFLIDGYPREKSQAIAFEKAIAPPSAILYFEASAETLTKRLLGRAASSGRADDNETTIKLRLKTFLENNQQVLDQYPTKISRINAETSVDAIFAEVQKVLDPIVTTRVDVLNKPIVWVLGGPGSGKGTQCDKIIAKYGFTHLSTGDLLRAEVKSGSERAKALSAIMEQGGLVPNEVVLELLTEAIRAKAANSKGFLIDGYPREKSQAIAFEKAIAPPSAILYFEASAETLTQRLLGRAASSGRADDNETTIKLRLKTFLENNQQVLDQYPTKISRINAETSVDAIFVEVQKVLDPIVATRVDVLNKPIVWVLGGPGSGKGTQCDKIIAKYGFTHLSTGDLLRAEVKSGSERAKALAAIMEQGGLVPNEVVLELLTEAIRAKAANSKGFLIDGYPREKSQAVAFEKAIAPPSAILYFEASAETLTQRLLGRAASSGRADDNETTIKLRLKTFLENNQQVLDQYPTKISRINAETSVDAIFAEVQKVLDPIVATRVDVLNKPIVWVLGGPGSGKGTQCDKIIAKYGFTHLSTGDLLRAKVKSGSEKAKALAAVMEQGGLVPNEVVLELLTEAIRAKAANSKGFLIDGYPREKSQAIAFEKAIAPPSAILYFEASAETLTQRLLGRAASSGRADDNETTIKLRLKTFLENNQQVLDQYPTKISRINAETSVDAIFAEVQKVLDPIVTTRVDILNKPIVWVLGGPGSGKGTQCDKIIAKYGFTHLSTGDLLRAEVKSGSERAKALAATMEQGGLVPNEVVLELLTEAIRAKAANSKGFLIDGYPREKSQAIAFEKAIAPPSAILYFEASSETLTKRLLGRAASSGRADDNETTIKLRLKTFLENNQQVLDQYPTKISRINAETSVDAIFTEVEKVLDPIVTA